MFQPFSRILKYGNKCIYLFSPHASNEFFLIYFAFILLSLIYFVTQISKKNKYSLHEALFLCRIVVNIILYEIFI